MHEFFSFNSPLREYFFCTSSPPPPDKFSNDPSLSLSRNPATLFVLRVRQSESKPVPHVPLRPAATATATSSCCQSQNLTVTASKVG